MFKEVMNDLWLARISSLSNEVGLYVVLLEVLLFMPNSLIRHDMKFKMAATAGLSLTLVPYGNNVSKCFFSETTWTVETKLPRNAHWKVLYKVSVFYADRKSKMAATAGHRLTLDPMGKYSNAFFSETTNMIKANTMTKRYQSGSQNQYIKEEQTTQWPKDTKGVVRISISKKNRQHNDQKIPKG